jgi:hypothetical protein
MGRAMEVAWKAGVRVRAARVARTSPVGSEVAILRYRLYPEKGLDRIVGQSPPAGATVRRGTIVKAVLIDEVPAWGPRLKSGPAARGSGASGDGSGQAKA